MAVLALCLLVFASTLSSCGYFTDRFLEEYGYFDDYGNADVLENDETTRRQPTVITQNWPQYTEKTPSTTRAPETTRTPSTTRKPETTVPETTDNIPDEFQNHVYLENVNNGRCKTLVGHVNVTVLIASDSETSWDSATRSALISSLEEQEKRLEKDAAGYGKKLDVTFSFIDVKIDGKTEITTFNLWEDDVIKAAGFTSKKDAQKELDNQNGADSNPIVIALNRAGRAYARQQTTDKNTEMLVIFSSDTTAFRHELYHLYGAEDFYYPKEVKELAENKLPESIMNSGEVTDALTAFIIGWDDIIDENAYEFLSGTSHLTAAYLKEENAKEMFTGLVTDHQLSYGIYTGYLEHGTPTGYGKIIYTEGGSYEGYFLGGSYHGEGTRIWASGDKYSGSFNMGKMHGKGTYTWNNGDKYSGDWLDGSRTGHGTYTWPNGTAFEGEWLNGSRNGQGTYTTLDGYKYVGAWKNDKYEGYGEVKYSNGASYKGYWREGNYHGQGTLVYANGSKYVGAFVDNKCEGQGTYTTTGGFTYTGAWKNDKYEGYGKSTWADGSTYEGYFKDGSRHGQGTYTYAAGHVYVGAWEGGERSGYGEMSWNDGSSYVGYWHNSKRHGQGKYINKNGTVFEGQWYNDQFQS